MEIAAIKRAVISVYKKDGLEEFARGLVDAGVEIISTGGTARFLTEKGIAVTEVSEVTGFPEIMDGRLKTLHPGILGGVLADRSVKEHMDQIGKLGIKPIDLIVVNLYPFEEVAAREGATLAEITENIDIGGPTMLRAASKNWGSVAVVTDPADYAPVLDEIRTQGGVTLGTRQRLVQAVFERTCAYDMAISTVLRERFKLENPSALGPGADTYAAAYTKKMDLRYGENPHQKAWFYGDMTPCPNTIATAKHLSGKELSYNNIGDLDGALGLALEFNEPTVVIVKHMSPCGAASSDDLREAFRLARECDPMSAFGGVIATNTVIDVATAEEITAPNSFFEAIVAPGYVPEALEIIKARKGWGANIRILELSGDGSSSASSFDMRRVRGGLLVQDWDATDEDPTLWTVATKRTPTDEELAGLAFGMKVVKYVRSNAVVLAKGRSIVGIGGGQPNRVDPVRTAVERAGEKAKGAVMASDAFFPFPDGPEIAIKAGVTAIAHPGGSKKDQDTFDLADQNGVAVVLTGVRHFKH